MVCLLSVDPFLARRRGQNAELRLVEGMMEICICWRTCSLLRAPEVTPPAPGLKANRNRVNTNRKEHP